MIIKCVARGDDSIWFVHAEPRTVSMSWAVDVPHASQGLSALLTTETFDFFGLKILNLDPIIFTDHRDQMEQMRIGIDPLRRRAIGLGDNGLNGSHKNNAQ